MTDCYTVTYNQGRTQDFLQVRVQIWDHSTDIFLLRMDNQELVLYPTFHCSREADGISVDFFVL